MRRNGGGTVPIEVSHLSHVYMRGTPFEARALDDVSFTIEDGAFVGVIGHTGSGKSTFLRVINRMAEQYGAVVSGHIMLDNSSIFMQDPNELRKKVGMVLTEPVLFAGTVLQNITAGLRLQGVTKRQVLEECAEETLRRMEIFNDFKDMLYLDAFALTRARRPN